MTNNKDTEQEVQKTSEELIREMVENILYKNKNKSNNINNDIDLKLELGETEFASFGNPRHMTVHLADIYRSKLIREYLNKESEFFSPYTGESKLHYFNEATNISQLWRQIKDKQLAIISADRQGDTSRRKELQADLRKSKLGFTKVMGSYIETNEYTGEKERVYEESYVVVNPVEPLEDEDKANNFIRFKDLMVSLCRKYNQESVYIQYPEADIRAYFDKEGEEVFSFSGNVILNNLFQEYYTRLKNYKDYSITFSENVRQVNKPSIRYIEYFRPDGRTTKPDGVYMAKGMLYNKIYINERSSKHSPITNSFLMEGISSEQGRFSKYKGGMIVFATSVNTFVDKTETNKIKSILKKSYFSIMNYIFKDRKLNRLVKEWNDYFWGDEDTAIGGYSIGNFFKGEYFDNKTKTRYDDTSTSIEISDVPSELLLLFATKLCEEFKQDTVLVKDFNLDKIYLADSNIVSENENPEEQLKDAREELKKLK